MLWDICHNLEELHYVFLKSLTNSISFSDVEQRKVNFPNESKCLSWLAHFKSLILEN